MYAAFCAENVEEARRMTKAAILSSARSITSSHLHSPKLFTSNPTGSPPVLPPSFAHSRHLIILIVLAAFSMLTPVPLSPPKQPGVRVESQIEGHSHTLIITSTASSTLWIGLPPAPSSESSVVLRTRKLPPYLLFLWILRLRVPWLSH
ncbi:hypothetical protein DL96DRAFT_1720936 [Flagelloscypha sp. PMI_526]|nr:hypothetical protein DL96DRAFT_1720936 [Flagelloscypha sp. PMI_526]